MFLRSISKVTFRRYWEKDSKDNPNFGHFGNILQKLQGFFVLLQHFCQETKK